MQDGMDLTITIYDSANMQNELEYLRVRVDDFVKVLQRWIDFMDVIMTAIRDYENRTESTGIRRNPDVGGLFLMENNVHKIYLKL